MLSTLLNKDLERVITLYLNHRLVKDCRYHGILNPDNISWKLLFERDFGIVNRADEILYDKLYDEVEKAYEHDRIKISKRYNIERLFDMSTQSYKLEGLTYVIGKDPLNIHYRYKDGSTLLMNHVLCRSFNVDLKIVEYLVQKGCDIHATNYNQEDILHTIVFSRHWQDYPLSKKGTIFDLLLKHGANINRRYKNNDTLLMLVARARKSADDVIFLLSLGADPHLKNKQGETAYDIAAKAPRKKVKMIEVLRALNAQEGEEIH